MELLVIIEIVVKDRVMMREVERGAACHHRNCSEIQSYDVQYLERWSVELLVIIEIVVKYRVMMCNT